MSKQASPKDLFYRSRLVGDLNRFAFGLFGKVCDEKPNDSLVLSPSSITTALAMTHLGAASETREELEKVLGYSLPDDTRLDAYRKLIQASCTDGAEFRSANRLWGQSSYHFFEEFLHTTQEVFGAGLAKIDFRNNAEAARCEINAWVEDQTANRIKELVSPGSLSDMSRLVLTNAVYFLGKWDSPFEKADTAESEFFNETGITSTVSMMYQFDKFKYAESESLKVLNLPYRSHRIESRSNFAMIVVLPNLNTELGHIVQELLTSGVEAIMPFEIREVRVYLPKFCLESTLALRDTLQKLGIRKAFSPEEADFSQMSEDPEGLFVSGVLQKAFFDVNEEGTEAAAATAMIMMGGCPGPPPPPVEFRADHPFIFIIRDTATGLIHFIGRFMGPKPA